MHRTAAFTNLGIEERSTHTHALPRITMLKKEGKRVLENADDIMIHLQKRFQDAVFEVLEGDAVASMSLKEQVRQTQADESIHWPRVHHKC